MIHEETKVNLRSIQRFLHQNLRNGQSRIPITPKTPRTPNFFRLDEDARVYYQLLKVIIVLQLEVNRKRIPENKQSITRTQKGFEATYEYDH